MKKALKTLFSLFVKDSPTDDIFPNLGAWNVKVECMLQSHYPPFVELTNSNNEETPQGWKFENRSIWSLICEEAVDTEYSAIHYRRVYEEVIRRGVDPLDYERIRKFMWLTAGWLNYEKALWDWCELDQEDINFAIEWQRSENLINEDMKIRMVEFVRYISGFENTKDKGHENNPSL